MWERQQMGLPGPACAGCVGASGLSLAAGTDRSARGCGSSLPGSAPQNRALGAAGFLPARFSVKGSVCAWGAGSVQRAVVQTRAEPSKRVSGPAAVALPQALPPRGHRLRGPWVQLRALARELPARHGQPRAAAAAFPAPCAGRPCLGLHS